MTTLLAVSDTHLTRATAGRLAELIASQLAVADVIVHAGDVVDQAVLDLLATYAPVHAVLGNNDHDLHLPARIDVEIGGCRVAAIHDSGTAAGRAARLRRWFPDADLVLFGHSHLPWHETDRRADGHVQHHLNPGSAIQRRRAPHRTVAMVELEGQVGAVRHVELP